MKVEKGIATIKEVTEQLENHNMELLFADLVSYAFNKMKGEDLISAEELVGDIFEKTILGVRNWNKSYTFKSFLFSAVKSLVSQYNKQYGEKVKAFDYEFESETLTQCHLENSSEVEALKKKLTAKLKEHIPPPDEIEEMVFECWMDGMKKSKDVAEFWGLDIKEVYKATKRLERKLNPIREFLNPKRNE